jgi:hypothetical protein
MTSPRSKRSERAKEAWNRIREKAQRNRDVMNWVLAEDLINFLISLVKESERSAVILGAERLNVSLEDLLKAFLKPSGNKTDNLFSLDGALGTFSRKIEVAYRLGLISGEFRLALDLVRKLRNDFAHATTVETLAVKSHSDRVEALHKVVSSENANAYATMSPSFKDAPAPAQPYLTCVMVLLVDLELGRQRIKKLRVRFPIRL